MTKKRIKYFSFDKIPYLYDNVEEEMLPFDGDVLFDPDLKVAG